MSAKEAGVITTINVRDGQVVSKNDLLVQIDDAQPQLEKRKAMAERNAAEVKANSDIEIRYDTQAAAVKKFGYLKKKEASDKVPGAVTEPDLQEARLDWVAATLKIEQAQLEAKIAKLTVDDKQAEVDAAEEAINRRQIRSPFDGVVEQIVPHVGEWVKPGDSVIRVVRIDKLQVEGFLRGDLYNPWDVRDKAVTVFVKLGPSSGSRGLHRPDHFRRSVERSRQHVSRQSQRRKPLGPRPQRRMASPPRRHRHDEDRTELVASGAGR